MLKVTQETLNLGLIRRIMLSVLVWAIGVIYHVDVYASWHIGMVDATCFQKDDNDDNDDNGDSGYIFRSGQKLNGDATCCGVAKGSTFYYAPVSLLDNMVRVYDKENAEMSTLLSWARKNAQTSSIVCMDAGTRSAMISFFAQSCEKTCQPDQPNICTTSCESNERVDNRFYSTSSATNQTPLTTLNVHVPMGDSKWHNRRRFSCDGSVEVSDFYGSAFATNTRSYLNGYAYPVLLVGGGFSSAYENLYTGDCRLKDSRAYYRLSPTKSCWDTSDPEEGPYIRMSLCLGMCPAGYYCPPDRALGDFFLNSSVSRTEVIDNVLTSFYEHGRRKYGGALQCEPGSYSSKAGSTSCKPCAVGTYQSLFAQIACSTCPSTSQYDSLGQFVSSITGTTSTTGAKSDTECFVNSSGYYLAGENGLFAFTGTCYYS